MRRASQLRGRGCSRESKDPSSVACRVGVGCCRGRIDVMQRFQLVRRELGRQHVAHVHNVGIGGLEYAGVDRALVIGGEGRQVRQEVGRQDPPGKRRRDQSSRDFRVQPRDHRTADASPTAAGKPCADPTGEHAQAQGPRPVEGLRNSAWLGEHAVHRHRKVNDVAI